MNAGTFLFDNQYQPDLLEKLYYQIKGRTWDHCLRMQEPFCQKKVFGGSLSEFVCDEALNRRQGFPEGSYTLFLKEKLLEGNQKYILEHFVKNHETVSLRDMLKNSRYTYQYICMLGDYVFMNLRCQLVQNGTYLIVPIDSADGITKAQFEWMLRDYDNGENAPNRWMLERRPKVSYAYGESTTIQIMDGTKVYIDQFDERLNFLNGEYVNDWKIAMSEMSNDLNLLRLSSGELKFDDSGRGYVEISQLFADHINEATFNVNCFLFNEPNKAGFTISPNYMGPTQNLKTVFDEYIATVDSHRLRVRAMDADGGTAVISGYDKAFDKTEEVINVGFDADQCWVSIPIQPGTAPIYPGNFRVWEYDSERDCLGRMVVTTMYGRFPNVYYYTMTSESDLLYIEWFRDDVTGGVNFDDFTKEYRDYIGSDFDIKMLEGKVAECVYNYTPFHSVYDSVEFTKNILLQSSHEYRVKTMRELLNSDGLNFGIFQDIMDAYNAPYTTFTMKMAEDPDLYAALQESGEFRIPSVRKLCPYDLYIDGAHISATQSRWDDFDQIITVPRDMISPNSVIIIDVYIPDDQLTAQVDTDSSFSDSLMPANFPIPMLSGNDLVVTTLGGKRFDPSVVNYGVFAMKYLIQVPENMVPWEEIGIDISDPRIADRVAYGSTSTSTFRSVVFEIIVPTDVSYYVMKTALDERIKSSDDNIIVLKAGDVLVSTEGYDGSMSTTNKFSKKVKTDDLAVHIDNYHEDAGKIKVWNATVWRKSPPSDLSKKPVVTIQGFCGAEDATRLMPFINGLLQSSDKITKSVPTYMGRDYHITFMGDYDDGDIGEVVYLPFPTDRFDLTSDANGQINTAGLGVMCITPSDMIFQDGARIPNGSFTRVTNQLYKVPRANTTYTIIRNHRDSNLYEFEDVALQSFMDRLFEQSPGFKQYKGLK